MFSIDQFLAPPPLSAIISIFLIAGIDFLGVLLLRALSLLDYKNIKWVRCQAPIVGGMLLAIILYPLALAHFTSRMFMQLIASFCMSLGIFHVSSAVKCIYTSKKKINEYWKFFWKSAYAKKLLIFMLVGMCLVALGPATSADALDYHLGFSIAILNYGGIPIIPEWFTSRLSGNGEVLNAMALSLGAEQFGSLLQYVSLLSIVSIIYCARNINIKTHNEIKSTAIDLIALATFSAPVILFLIGTAKPQMWAIAMITFAFALIIHPSRRKLSRKNILVGYTLICLLAMTAMQTKFNYIVEGTVVVAFAFLLMIKRRYFWMSVSITLATIILIMLPPIIWKALVFNTNWGDVLIHPIPGHFPGVDIFINNVINSKLGLDNNSHFIFPFLVLIPDSIASFSTILGIGMLVFIGFKLEKDLWLWSGILAASICLGIIILFAPISARLYLVPYFWFLFILALQPNENFLRYYHWLKWPIFCQAFSTTLAVWYGVFLLFPGALLPSWRIHIMEKNANGYEIMKWADTALPKNAIFLNSHRSMALAPRKAISSDWLNFINVKSDESMIYLERLKSEKVSHILIIGPADYKGQLSNCYGKKIAGPGIGHFATRNPFNQGSEYEAWILEFRSEKLPTCASELR